MFKKVKDLTEQELIILKSKYKEVFDRAFTDDLEHHLDDLIFQVIENQEMKAAGLLLFVGSINIDGYKIENIYGFSDIVSFEEGKGYGKRLIEEIKNYCYLNNLIALAWCNKRNRKFYQNCGLTVIEDLVKFFEYHGEKDVGDDDVLLISKDEEIIARFKNIHSTVNLPIAHW